MSPTITSRTCITSSTPTSWCSFKSSWQSARPDEHLLVFGSQNAGDQLLLPCDPHHSYRLSAVSQHMSRQAHRKLSCICRTQQHWNRYDGLHQRIWVHKEQSGSKPGGSSLFSCRLYGGSVPADYLHIRRDSPPGCDMLHLTFRPPLPDCRYYFRPAQRVCTYRFGEAPYPYTSAYRLKDGEQNSSHLKWLLPNTWRHVPNVI